MASYRGVLLRAEGIDKLSLVLIRWMPWRSAGAEAYGGQAMLPGGCPSTNYAMCSGDTEGSQKLVRRSRDG